ncbi:hypothetical protein HGRIS_013563 [Hohenbuehelia grisea]|uniref:Rad1-domain-containing protein n=1 Tax=Hohenbuehelia grisea TaxID=104357 RepID=A0ABR3IW65_9AGAR
MPTAQLPPVLKASVHDVRYLAGLLRGVNFVNKATVTVTDTGITITVEEARSLLATAFIFADIFDEFVYNAEKPSLENSSQASDSEDAEQENAAFEIPLGTLIECLNIFGTAGASASSSSSRARRWKRDDDDRGSENEDDNDGRRLGPNRGGDAGNTSIEQYFASGSEKRTGMRMSYAGSGYPLMLIIAEEADGPTTACEITTFDPEPHLELPFNANETELKIILKSSWLRDALSELDPSFEKLTFIGNPPPESAAATGAQTSARRKSAARSGALQPPMLRIQAVGGFGSIEMDYPNDREVLETFECAQRVCFSYRAVHVTRALRALQNSTKTSLRIDSSGLMSLQFLMPSPVPRSRPGTKSGTEAFIDFKILPLDDDL